MNIEIIYEDNHIILCRKPAGVATQTKRLGQQDMESLLKNYRAKKGEPPYIGVVHRLDQPVEGLMVFAKNQKTAANLSKQIQEHMIGKHYYAVSSKAPDKMEGMLENYLLTDKKSNFTQVVDKGYQDAKNCRDAKKAILEYKVLYQTEQGTLFDILLHTGRQHQIRVQMAHMGCPLVGDEKYGVQIGDSVRDARQGNLKKSPLALCSYRLEFAHPATGKKMDYSIVPEGEAFLEWQKIIETQRGLGDRSDI
ncbi:MAG: RluA family pseudouridine synthase [Agathobacter sp.]